MSRWTDRGYSEVVTAKRNGILRHPSKVKCLRCGKQARVCHQRRLQQAVGSYFYLCDQCHKERHKELGWGYEPGGRPKINDYNLAKMPPLSFAIVSDYTISKASWLVNKFRGTGR